MVATPRHFAINADDVDRAQGFYERVFGWKIIPTQWGDGFRQITIGGVIAGAVQRLRKWPRNAPDAVSTNSFELSFAVEDFFATLKAISSAGGTVLLKPDGPGTMDFIVGYFQDTEGNICGLAQYNDLRMRPPATLRYFSMNADNVQRAKAFYERVFGWTYRPWGPPDYYQVQADDGMIGALQERRALIKGERMNAPEPTIGVDDIRATLAVLQEAGGIALRPITRIEGGPEIAYVQDTEGNIFCVGQYPVAPQ